MLDEEQHGDRGPQLQAQANLSLARICEEAVLTVATNKYSGYVSPANFSL